MNWLWVVFILFMTPIIWGILAMSQEEDKLRSWQKWEQDQNRRQNQREQEALRNERVMHNYRMALRNIRDEDQRVREELAAAAKDEQGDWRQEGF